MNLTITESDKKLLSFLTAFLVGAVFFLLVFRPLSEKIDELKKEIEVAKQQQVDIEAAVAVVDEMIEKEQSTKEEMLLKMQCFYPMLQSQEAENMVTILMLNHGLQVQNLSITMSEVPSGLKWYQYAENATASQVMPGDNSENAKPEDSFGVYTIRVNGIAEGTPDNLMSFLNDISGNYPAISILSAEWSAVDADGQKADLTFGLEIYMCNQ